MKQIKKQILPTHLKVIIKIRVHKTAQANENVELQRKLKQNVGREKIPKMLPNGTTCVCVCVWHMRDRDGNKCQMDVVLVFRQCIGV